MPVLCLGLPLFQFSKEKVRNAAPLQITKQNLLAAKEEELQGKNAICNKRCKKQESVIVFRIPMLNIQVIHPQAI